MSRRIIRWGPKVYGPEGRIPLGKTTVREKYVNTGRLRLVPLGERAVGAVEDELDAIVNELIEARDNAPARRPAVPREAIMKGVQTRRNKARRQP